MPDTIDPRFGQPLWADDNSAFPGVAGFTNIFKAIYGKSAIGRHGLTSAMGSPSVPDVFYWATDTKRLWCSGDGSAWTEVSPVGGGGIPQGQQYGRAVAGAEGTSRIAARADHKHPEADWPVAIWRFTRAQEFTGTVASYSGIPAAGMHTVMNASFTGPSGLYMFGYNVSLQTQSLAVDAFSVGNIRYTVNGLNVSEDCRADLTKAATTFSFTRVQAVGAGPCSLALAVQSRDVPAWIFTNGSNMWATYLGPS